MNQKFAVLLFFLITTFSIDRALAEQGLTDLAKSVKPAVVLIETFDIDKKLLGKGSGFFISENGHLVTNYHVLDGAYEAYAKIHTGQRFPITKVIAENEACDLMEVKADLGTHKVLNFLIVSDEAPEIAESILVVGNPRGLEQLEQTVSTGIISAKRSMVAEVYQITAPISQGSSGGPVVNMQGLVIGVVSFFFKEGQNLNFAIAGKHVNELTHMANTKPFRVWANKGIKKRKLVDLKDNLAEEKVRLAQELENLRKRIEIKRGQLNKNDDQVINNLNRKGKQLKYEYEALMSENNQLESMRYYVSAHEFNKRRYDLNVKWNNYEMKRKAYQDEIDSYNGWASRNDSALRAEIFTLETEYTEKERIFDAKVDEYESLSNGNDSYSSTERQDHNGESVAEIHFKGGGIMKVSSWWDAGDMIMFQRPGGMLGVARGIEKSKIKEIIEYRN